VLLLRPVYDHLKTPFRGWETFIHLCVLLEYLYTNLKWTKHILELGLVVKLQISSKSDFIIRIHILATSMYHERTMEDKISRFVFSYES
jgi:hypothetical protein